MEHTNWLTFVADTSRIMHASLSIAQKKLREQMTVGKMATEAESLLLAKLGEAISSLSSVSIYADIAADDERWRLAMADGD
jgi:hypothetical protein